MTALRCKAICTSRRGQDRFRCWSPCTAAAGCRARAAHFNIGARISPRGYALFAISYRFAKTGQKTFPHAVRTCWPAFNTCAAMPREFKLDAERIGLIGASAGAHLSALAALAGSVPPFAGGYPQDAHAAVSTKVKVLVGVYGIYDVLEMWQKYNLQNPLDNNIEKFIGVSPMDDRKPYFEASPISYATIANNKTAVLLACGTEDDLVNRHAQTDAFLLALKQAGFFVRPCILQGAPHYWMNDPIDEPGSFTGFLAPRLMRFLAEKL